MVRENHFRLAVACSLLAYVHAAKFKLIAPGSTEVQVSVDGQLTTLVASDPTLPYFVGDAAASPSAKYKYIADGKEEPFDRILNTDKTYNDFFGRPVTYSNIPPLPQAISQDTWTRGGSIQKGSIWDDNYIPSIFVTGDEADLDDLVKNVKKKKSQVKITFIGLDSIQTFENCSFGIHGAGKKHNNAKQSWDWTLPEGQYIENRNWIKLRHMEEDPTQMREKLYADILASMGTYANRANMVRFFINGKPFGTFNMLDDIPRYSYIRAMFYNGNPPSQMGPLYDGASGADFAYSTDSTHYDAWIPNTDSPANQEAIDPLCKELRALDVQNDAAVERFSALFDIKQFLRFMVMEYLAGQWDGYWMEQTNIGAYYDPSNSKWYFLGQDFDATFGVNLAQDKDFVNMPYTEFPSKFPKAVMINKLLQNQNIQREFESYLKDTVTYVFNNVTLTQRVLAYHDFIRPDLAWDRQITQLSPGINFGWTFQQTEDNLWEGVAAPNGNGGGADQWGLIEWIAAKSKVVAEQYNLVPSQPKSVPSATVSSSTPNSASNGTPSTTSEPRPLSTTENTASLSQESQGINLAGPLTKLVEADAMPENMFASSSPSLVYNPLQVVSFIVLCISVCLF